MSTEAKVGAFTIAGLALLAAVVIMLSGVSLKGDKGYRLYAGFDQVIGVQEQSVVRLSGVPVGTVESVKNDGGGVTVAMKINGDAKIPRGSSVTVGSTGVMGDKFLNITPVQSDDYLADGDYLIGEDEAGMDSLFTGLNKVVEQAQQLMTSLNTVVGNPKFQSSFIELAVNLRDTTAHLNGMMAALESMAVQNQGNVNSMLSNLSQMAASLDRTANTVEAMMDNLATVGADPQTAENLRLTLQNITEASQRINHAAQGIEEITTDEKVKDDAKEIIHKARKITDKAGNTMAKLEKIKIKPQADVLYSGADHDWATNFNVELGPEKGNFLSLGVDDIGGDDGVNAMVGRHRHGLDVRGGVINGEAGIGLDADKGRAHLSLDAYDPDDVTLRLRGRYDLGDSGTSLLGQWNNVNDSDKRVFYFGLRQYFN